MADNSENLFSPSWPGWEWAFWDDVQEWGHVSRRKHIIDTTTTAKTEATTATEAATEATTEAAARAAAEAVHNEVLMQKIRARRAGKTHLMPSPPRHTVWRTTTIDKPPQRSQLRADAPAFVPHIVPAPPSGNGAWRAPLTKGPTYLDAKAWPALHAR